MGPELTEQELRRLRDRGAAEQDGLVLAAVEELLALRAELARLRTAGETLLAETGRIGTSERR